MLYTSLFNNAGIILSHQRACEIEMEEIGENLSSQRAGHNQTYARCLAAAEGWPRKEDRHDLVDHGIGCSGARLAVRRGVCVLESLIRPVLYIKTCRCHEQVGIEHVFC